jgi:hypothetical protein
MQKNKKSLGGGGDALAEGVLGLGAAKGTLGFVCSQPDDRGAASPERTTKAPKHQLKTCSSCREGGRGPASPPGRQGSSEIHLHQPWR